MIDNCGNIYVVFSKLLKLTDIPITEQESIIIYKAIRKEALTLEQ